MHARCCLDILACPHNCPCPQTDTPLLLLPLPPLARSLQCSTALTGKRITSGFCSEGEAAEHGYDPVSARAWSCSRLAAPG